MVEILEKGGVLMYPILMLSIISLAIFFERIFTLRKNKFIPIKFVKGIEILVREDKYSEALNMCKNNSCSAAKIFYVAIENRDLSWEQAAWLVDETGKQEAEKIDRFQETMGAIVVLAPLLGLLGTVLGMIKIFGVLATGGAGDAQALSGGISEALLTTAAGLLVAIPAQIFLHFVKFKADSVVRALEIYTSDLLGLIMKKRSSI